MLPIKTELLTIQRKIVAWTTTKSWREIPHVSFTYEPDVTELFNIYRDEIKPLGLSLNVVILKLIIEGLKRAKSMNGEIIYNRITAKGKVLTKDEISISMPMIFPSGEMMTVRLHEVNNMSMSQLRNYIIDIRRRSNSTNTNEVMYDIAKGQLIEQMKKGHIISQGAKILINQIGSNRPEHFRGKKKREYESIPATDRLIPKDLIPGTVTVSNVGSLYPSLRGNMNLLEILPGQVCAIGLNAVQDKPMVIENASGEKEIAIRKTIGFCIAFDHRAIDFNDIIPFIKYLDEILAEPKKVLEWINN